VTAGDDANSTRRRRPRFRGAADCERRELGDRHHNGLLRVTAPLAHPATEGQIETV
jgi:hypothetical protein